MSKMQLSTEYYMSFRTLVAAALLTLAATAQAHYDPCTCYAPPPPCPCDYLQATGAGPVAPAQMDFNSVVYFANDSATLTDDAKLTLDVAVNAIRRMSDHVLIKAEGYTDSNGSSEHNELLGLRRARMVRAYLVKGGVPVNRIGVVSFGETMPIADNRTAEGRALNRRVVITAR